jgi:allantoicase
VTAQASSVPDFGRSARWFNLAQPRLGAQVVAASDEFFGAKERLIRPEAPSFEPHIFDEHGKQVDGWETRRRRVAGHGWCVVRLGGRAVLHSVDIDTAHFTGNFPMAATLEAACCDARPADDAWTQLVPATLLRGDAHHELPLSASGPWNWLRLNIDPDGGVARLRVYGRFRAAAASDGELVELAGLMQGGRAVAWSDEHYSTPNQLLLPDRAPNMGDGWETRRRRTPGHEWAIIELGRAGIIQRVELDTTHNKGNYPERASLLAAYAPAVPDAVIAQQSMFWDTLLPEQPLGPDALHTFARELREHGPITHVRLNIIPDGGMSRVRLWGVAAPSGG